MKSKFKKECSKFYRKHWKTKHFIITKAAYFENIIPLSRDVLNYEYSVNVFKDFGKAS